MALPIITNGFRTITRWTNTQAGTPWSVTLDFLVRTPTVAPDAQDLADAVGGAWRLIFDQPVGTATVADHFVLAVETQSVDVYPLDGTSAPVTEAVTVPARGTDNNGDCLPPDVSLVCSKRTATRGRAGRGRLYLTGLSNRAMDTSQPGFVLPALTGALQFALNTHMLELNSSTDAYDAQVLSQATIPAVMRPITRWTVDNHWDTQRRRGVR